jgi:Dyp-type peroxidase family
MNIVTTPRVVDREDIQGIVASGYDHLDYSRFVFLKIKNVGATRKWLADIIPQITNARHPGDNKAKACLNLAFSLKGLEKLVPTLLKDFPHEFDRGMHGEEANLVLGDRNEGDWEYGALKQPDLNVLVILYGSTDKELDSLHSKVTGSPEFKQGLRTIGEQQDSVIPPGDETEPFGFRDGLSQPLVQGLLGRGKPTESPINTGEFVLGYENELNLLTQIPSIESWADPLGRLADHPSSPGKRAFGMNGTYLVFRKLIQKVNEFRDYIHNSASEPNERERIAAKIVGRWRSGAPLVLSPDSPGSEPSNDFLFMETDPDGLVCPIGAHIRRANPRDSLDMPPSRSILISRRHRLLRRGRKFSDKPKNEEGLYFIVLSADLRRQYEFVQQQWINDPSFNGLDNDRDPLVGDNSTGGIFTIQAKPFNRHLKGLPQFVVMKGGGYFFLPGLRAVRFLATYRP